VTLTETDFAISWKAWHRKRLASLEKPYGMLAPTGLYWLSDEPQSFDTVPGLWSLTSEGVVVRAELRAGLRVGGRLVDGEALVRPAGRQPAAEYGKILIDVLVYDAAGDDPPRVAVRSRDPESAAHRSFAGLPFYDPDPRWVVPARFERYAVGRQEVFGTVAETLHKNLNVFGRVLVTLDGTEYSLEVYSSMGGELHIPFRDLTNGAETFPGRVLAVSWPPGAEGENFEFDLDFNRALNAPCVFTEFTTCALLPAGNTLSTAVEAGEKLPAWRPAD
jgi:uncharacterized protein (DUF1684 family)